MDRFRFIFLDLPGGGTTTIMVRSHGVALWPPFLAQASPVIASFSFGTS